ncbi:MAG: MFS transporter [Pseudomonas sp.]|jgi:predicted MFS family arabinose efflux permease|nr:MFS transporter [Pseudomonas sp.]MDY0414859.1 MFS transporter [Pseudomonas sp.]
MMNSQDVAAKPTPRDTVSGSINPKAQAHVYPNQRQAWIVVAGMALTLFLLFGTTLNSFGVFIPPITTTFQSSHEQTANIPSAFMLTMTLAMPLAGWLLDRIGPRAVMTTGAMLTGLGYVLASMSQDIDSVTLAMAVSGAGVGASTYVPAIALVMRWVELKRQGLALGAMLSGATLGTIIFPILLTHIIELYGWRFAMQCIAALALLICVPLLLWLARLPSQPLPGSEAHTNRQELSGRSISQALRLPRYWLWVALQLLMTFSTLGIFINLIPYLISVGYTPQEAAATFAIKSVAGLSGSFLFGLLSSRWGIKPLLMVGTAIGGFGVLALLLAHDPSIGFSAVLVFSIAWGATFNLVNQLSPMLMEETVGQRNFGTLLGIGSLIAGVGGAYSPKLIGYLLDTSGSYSIALMLCALCMFGAMIPIAFQPKRVPVSTVL